MKRPVDNLDMAFGPVGARMLCLLVSAALLISLPLWAPGVVIDVLSVALLYGFLAAAWNIVGGFAGLISVGHAAFFGLGAYGVAVCYVTLGLSPYLGIVVGVAAAAGAACLLGIISFWLPFAGYNFLLLTLAFAELLRAVFRTLGTFGGSDGIIFPFAPGIATLQFRSSVPYYFIALSMVVGVVGLTWLIRNSAFGLRLEAIRDDEGSALASGMPTARIKLKALAVSAALTAFGGAFYATMFSFITPDHVFSLDFSVAMITAALIGGRGTVWGPVVGGVLVWSLTELLVRLPLGSGVGANLSVILYGLALIIIVQRLPKGVVPTLVGEKVRGRFEGGTVLRRYLRRRNSALISVDDQVAEREAIPSMAQGGQGRSR
ncbi:MAG: branched-chain amino acid ABC transporter permease [Proteobacteria bacterium]|nr:branched-chain amino acid ABC transporter permease [Pseudomonadota bacterium]